MNNFYDDAIQVDITREEWDKYTPEQKKRFMGKLSAIDIWLAQFILECLQEYERQIAEETQINFEKTFAFYYGESE
jgi:hypothetical protein